MSLSKKREQKLGKLESKKFIDEPIFFSPIHNSNSSAIKNYLYNDTGTIGAVKVIRKGTMVEIKATRCNGVSECWNNLDEVYCSMDTFLTIFIGNFLYCRFAICMLSNLSLTLYRGGFHLAATIIRELKSHMIPYKFNCSHWWKLQHSDWRANYYQCNEST